MKKITLSFLLILLLASCMELTSKSEFSKAGWGEKYDWTFPLRESMLDDLLQHHKLKGLTRRQIIDSLGEPANDEDSTKMYYEIITDFGSDIDPVYAKTLVLSLSKDSVVTDFKVREWKKDD